MKNHFFSPLLESRAAGFCKTRTFNCSPIIVDCSKLKVFNPNFGENPVAGTLGSCGSAAHWEKVSGSPKLEKLPTGEWAMTLAANADGSDAIRSLEQICLEKDTGNVALTMRYDLPPGQYIVKIALVRGDDFSDAANCGEWGPTCFEIAELELETSKSLIFWKKTG